MQPDIPRQRASAERKIRLRLRYPIGYQRPANIVEWSEGESANMQT